VSVPQSSLAGDNQVYHRVLLAWKNNAFFAESMDISKEVILNKYFRYCFIYI
jgi:hypothetical protein